MSAFLACENTMRFFIDRLTHIQIVLKPQRAQMFCTAGG